MNTPRQFSSVSPAHDNRNASDEKSSMTHTVDPPEFPESLKIRNRENFFDAHNASDVSPDVSSIALFILSQSISFTSYPPRRLPLSSVQLLLRSLHVPAD